MKHGFNSKNMLSMEPYHRIPRSNFMEIFYISINVSSRVMVYSISGGALMRLYWDIAQEMLYEISITNRGWHTRGDDR